MESFDISIGDVAQLEGNAGLTDFVFTVVQPAQPQTVTVAYSTADGTATLADNDYIAQSGTLVFLPGTTSSKSRSRLSAIRSWSPTKPFS